jgi:predicted GIY-YIG superfamily endonuclease
MMAKKQSPRNYIRYIVKKGGKTMHGGITERPLEERREEHKRKWPSASVKKVGPKVTEKTAREWEKKQGFS